MAEHCNHTIHKHISAGTTPMSRCSPSPRARPSNSGPSIPPAGQITPKSTVADIPKLDFAKVNPVSRADLYRRRRAGRCDQGDAARFHPQRLGLDREYPGLRPARRPVQGAGAAYLELRHPAPGARRLSGRAGRVPLKPFCGTIGLAPARGRDQHSIVPPRRVGGNMDIRDMSAGTELYLPVEVAGGLFSVGDTHAAQGDGEVCGTAIESQMNVAREVRAGEEGQSRLPALSHPRARSAATATPRAMTSPPASAPI